MWRLGECYIINALLYEVHLVPTYITYCWFHIKIRGMHGIHCIECTLPDPITSSSLACMTLNYAFINSRYGVDTVEMESSNPIPRMYVCKSILVIVAMKVQELFVAFHVRCKFDDQQQTYKHLHTARFANTGKFRFWIHLRFKLVQVQFQEFILIEWRFFGRP